MNRSLLRLCLWAASAAVAGGRPLSWLFNSKQSEFAATCRRLEREAQEFESGERVLLEQLRQMRVTTGNLRAELRESVKKSDEAVANATAYVAHDTHFRNDMQFLPKLARHYAATSIQRVFFDTDRSSASRFQC